MLLALINFILGWSVYLSGICRIGSCSDESGHLYPLLGIFRIGILIKYSLNFLAIWSSREITWSSLSNLILRCFVTFSDRSGFAVFKMFYYQVQPKYQGCHKNSFFHFFFSFSFHFVDHVSQPWLFLKFDLFMISLLNFLFIRGDWLALTYLFFNGACLSRVIFTDSFSILNGTFCWSHSFDKSNSVSFIKFLNLR